MLLVSKNEFIRFEYYCSEILYYETEIIFVQLEIAYFLSIESARIARFPVGRILLIEDSN